MPLFENIKNNKQTLMLIKLIIATFFWGGTFVAGKIAAPYVTPSVLGFMRFIFASIFLIYILKKKENGLPHLNKKQFLQMTFLALTSSVIYNISIQVALQTIDAIRASLIMSATPLILTLGAVIFLKEKITFVQAIGLITTTLGAIFIITDGNIKLFITNTGLSYGDIAVFVGMFSWVAYVFAGKRMSGVFSSLAVVTWAIIIATMIFFPLALYELYFYENIFNKEVFLVAIYLGIFGTGLAFVWFYEAIDALGAARTSVFLNFEPLAAVLLATIFLGEKLSLAMFCGGVLSILGVYLANQSNLIIKFSKKLNKSR